MSMCGIEPARHIDGSMIMIEFDKELIQLLEENQPIFKPKSKDDK